MALPTVADCKSYLRVEDADEDVLFSQLLAKAKADVEAAVGYALVAAAFTHVDYTECDTAGLPAVLRLPGPFLATGPAPVVTDKDGTTVDATTYYLDSRGGEIRGKAGTVFRNRPYTIVATVGLSAHPDYATRLEAIAAQAIIDLVAHRYQNRNPAALQEGDEGGGSKFLGTTPEAMPLRIQQDLMALPRALAA